MSLVEKSISINIRQVFIQQMAGSPVITDQEKSHYAKRIKMHEGVDIGAPSGHPIVATADGTISYAGKKPGFGNFIKIKHGYGIETVYAHAKKLYVKSGEQIKRGQKIASVGSTGYSTGPHVHYEVRVNAVPVDPLYFILN